LLPATVVADLVFMGGSIFFGIAPALMGLPFYGDVFERPANNGRLTEESSS
jgi:hypothetical protein